MLKIKTGKNKKYQKVNVIKYSWKEKNSKENIKQIVFEIHSSFFLFYFLFTIVMKVLNFLTENQFFLKFWTNYDFLSIKKWFSYSLRTELEVSRHSKIIPKTNLKTRLKTKEPTYMIFVKYIVTSFRSP
jgi:hypothetical protein